MKKMFKIFAGILAVIVLIIAGMVYIQIDFSNDDDLDVFIETKMKSLTARGMAVVFIKNGQITWSRNYGYADKEASKRVTEKTIFHIASLSKTVTGAAVMQLYENGLINLDSSIDSYLPFEIINPNFSTREITVRMLLQHKSSLIDNKAVLKSLFTIESGLPDSEVTLEEFVRGYFLKGGKWYNAEDNFSHVTPGEEFSYSNAVFGLLGYIVEQVSGQPFNEYCNDNIFTPLGMETAGWLSTEINLENMAVQYDAGTRLKLYSYATYSDGALKISIQDYSKFVIAIMNGGAYNGARILKESTVKEMLPENHEENLVWANDVLDEFFIDAKDHHLQGHSGGDPGSFGLVAFNPEQDTALIMFMNGTPPLLGLRIFNVVSFIKRLGSEAQLY